MKKSRLLRWLKREQKLIAQIKQENSTLQDQKKVENLTSNLLADILTNNFVILLALATVIASFGLLSNSAATIIGGMIIAPLMTPIIGLAFGIVILDLRILAYSLIRLFQGIFFTIFLAYITTHIIGFRLPDTEILARTEPTLLDLGVAIAAGIAGAYARIHRSVSDSIPGVAIAVALVPPLCVVGICLSSTDFELAEGAFILFLTNLIGIILSAIIIFLCHSYGHWRRSLTGILILLLGTFLIGIPLNLSFRKMIAENKIRDALYQFDIRYSSDGEVYIDSVEVTIENEQMWVILDVINQPEDLNKTDRNL